MIDAKQSDEIVSSTILNFDMFNDLKWYNVAIVVSNSSKFHLYIDGIKVVSKLGDTWPIFDRNIFWDSNYVAYAGHGLEQHSIHNITIDDFVGEVKNVYIWTRILDQLDIENLCDGVAFTNASSKLHVSYNPSVPFLDMQSYTEINIIKLHVYRHSHQIYRMLLRLMICMVYMVCVLTIPKSPCGNVLAMATGG